MKKGLWLIVWGSDETVFSFAIRQGRQIIGRAEDCDIRVPFNSVSRHHAALAYERGEVTVHDLDSRHGTWVEDQRITSQVLPIGGALRLGRAVRCEVREELPYWADKRREVFELS